ncbi:MAG: FecR domain-containing protein [bacterium]|nr:FecR domain-containing protein [bacterium]
MRKKIQSIRKKIVIFFFTLSLLIGGFFVPITSHANEYTDGAFRIVGDPSVEDIINDLMFKDATISIDKSGKITGRANTTLSEYEFSRAFYSGTATLNMTGDYDYKKKRFDGTFSVNHTLSWEDRREEPLVSHTGNWTMMFEGTFSGEQSVEEGALIIDFTGTKKTTSKTEGSNGVVDEDDRSIKWNNRAIFNDEAGCSVNLSSIQSKNKFAFIPAAQAIDSGARFTDFSGEVTVSHGRNYEELQDNLRFAEHDMVLDVGSHINTESDSSAIIAFADMTTFCMKEFSRIILLPQNEGPQSKLSLLSGKIWANVKSILKDGSMDVTMNQAVAGIKGTTFVLEDDGNNSTIKVIEGSVEFTSKATGKTEMIATGETITADENGLGQKTTFDVSAESKTWNNLTGSSSDKTTAGTKNYPYYLAGLVSLVIVGLGIFVIKKKKE